MSGVTVTPQPVQDDASISFTLSAAATVSVEIRDAASTVVRHLVTNAAYGPGASTLRWHPVRDDRNLKIANGTYTAVVSATDTQGNSSSVSSSFVVQR